MTVTLSRPYGQLASGAVVSLNASTEAALIAQGIATNGGTLTTGAFTTNEFAGRASIAAGASSVVINHPSVTANSVVTAVVAQASSRCGPFSSTWVHRKRSAGYRSSLT